jgi:hypothetical protein
MALAIPRRLYADFYNKIGTNRTNRAGLMMSVDGGMVLQNSFCGMGLRFSEP